jgi:hypothetical protein
LGCVELILGFTILYRRLRCGMDAASVAFSTPETTHMQKYAGTFQG